MIEKIKAEPALVSGAIQALLGLLLAFGVNLSNEQTGAILAVTAAVLALITRATVTPLAKLDDYGDPDGMNDPALAYDPNHRGEGGYGYPGWVGIVVLVLVILIFLAVFGIIGR